MTSAAPPVNLPGGIPSSTQQTRNAALKKFDAFQDERDAPRFNQLERGDFSTVGSIQLLLGYLCLDRSLAMGS